MEDQTKKKVITTEKRIIQRLLEDCQASFHILVKDFWPKIYAKYKRLARLKDK